MESFKEQLTLDDILHGIPYKMLLELRDARADRLEREKKRQQDLDKAATSEDIRKQIMNAYKTNVVNSYNQPVNNIIKK